MTPFLDPEQRRQRRELLRRHHPDLGGDPAEFLRVVRAFESGGERPGRRAAGDEVRFVRRPRGVARIAAWVRGRVGRRPPRPPRVL